VSIDTQSDTSRRPERSSAPVLRLVVSWALVGIPLAWGVWQVFQKSLALFR
jgi:hypothetical protein